MENTIKISKKTLWKIAGGLLAFIIALIIILGFFLDIFNTPMEGQTEKSQYYENIRYTITTTGGATIAAIGIILTYWGRILIQDQNQKIQDQINENSKANREQAEQAQEQMEKTQTQIELSQKANQHERYEKAARMLGDPILAVRIAGCHALRSLGIEDLQEYDEADYYDEGSVEIKTMATQCRDLLLAYICNPHIDDEQRKEAEKDFSIGSWDAEKKLEMLFPARELLRADIQAAADSIYAFHNHCLFNNLDLFDLKFSPVSLPRYFWRNTKKSKVFLQHARIQGDLQAAYLDDAFLVDADFTKADLGNAYLVVAIFGKANLQGTNLEGANLSGAEMDTVQNLTKEQILKAKWGYYGIGENKTEAFPPLLTQELENDKEIQKWLSKPHYTEYEAFLGNQ